MASTENDTNEEKFFDNIRDTLRNYCSMTLNDISEEDLQMAYPIQTELKQLSQRYKNPELIGRGGMKEVFKVTDLKASQNIAMAKLKKEAGRESTESFLREARLTACLQHPNIISIYDLGFDEHDSPYFTMELLGGKNLHEIISESSLNRNQLLDIFNKVCDAVAYAHSRQILHLDLKPDNIQIGNYGEVHVCDWGLAKILTEDDDMEIDEDLDPNILNHATIHGRIKGSPGYMAPEQATPYGDKDIRSDIYALGAILYTIFTGESPIKGETIDTLLEKTKNAEITPISKFTDVPKSIQAIVNKSLSKEKSDRYQSVQNLKADLDKYIHGFATLAENAGFITQLQLLVQRNKKELSIICLILIFIAITLFTSFERIKEEREQAIAAKNEALKQKNIAEENFELLQEEQRISRELRDEISLLFREITESDDLSSAKRKIELLNEGIRRETKFKKKDAMLKKKAVLHFILQEFPEAVNSFSAAQKVRGYDKILEGAKWAANLTKDNKMLDEIQIGELLYQIGNANYLEIMKAFYGTHIQNYADKNTSSKDFLLSSTVMLNALNNLWDKKRHEHKLSLEDGVLKLPPKNYHTFSLKEYRVNIFQKLDFHTLDLSYTSFFEFIQLRGLKFKKLIIVGCRTNPFDTSRVTMLKEANVEEIVLDSDYISKVELDLLKNHFRTIDVKKSD